MRTVRSVRAELGSRARRRSGVQHHGTAERTGPPDSHNRCRGVGCRSADDGTGGRDLWRRACRDARRGGCSCTAWCRTASVVCGIRQPKTWYIAEAESYRNFLYLRHIAGLFGSPGAIRPFARSTPGPVYFRATSRPASPHDSVLAPSGRGRDRPRAKDFFYGRLRRCSHRLGSWRISGRCSSRPIGFEHSLHRARGHRRDMPQSGLYPLQGPSQECRGVEHRAQRL